MGLAGDESVSKAGIEQFRPLNSCMWRVSLKPYYCFFMQVLKNRIMLEKSPYRLFGIYLTECCRVKYVITFSYLLSNFQNEYLLTVFSI